MYQGFPTFPQAASLLVGISLVRGPLEMGVSTWGRFSGGGSVAVSVRAASNW